MKKNFTVNICGTIFHIDEDAYDLLNQYFLSLKEHYKNEEGCDEILGDIESRVAEMLIEKTNSNVKVVSLSDINFVINVMGKPEQFDEKEQTSSKGESKAKAPRRLYRDPDNKVVGGVCSGIGAYFNMDSLIIRILFIVAILLGFSGVLVYIVLWIAIPEAKTTIEKLEMKGEKINLNNIEKNVKEEFSNIKEKFSEFSEDAKAAFHKIRQETQPNKFERFFTFIFTLIKYFVRAFGIFIGLIFIIIGLFVLVGLIASFFGAKTMTFGNNAIISSYSFKAFLSLFVDAPYQITLIYIGLSLFIGVPLIMLIYNGIKIVLGLKSRKRYIGISAFSFWLAGLIITTFLSIHIAKSYSSKSFSAKKISLIQPSNNTLAFEVNQSSEVSNSELQERIQQGISPFNIVALKGKDVFYGVPKLAFLASDNDSFQVVVISSARGESLADAEKHIEGVKYNLKQVGSTLLLDPIFQFSASDKWRVQDVKIICKIPEGKIIDLTKNFKMLDYSSDKNDDGYKDLRGKKWIMVHGSIKEYFEPKPLNIVIDSVKTVRK